MSNKDNENCSTQRSDYPAVLTAARLSPGSNVEGKGLPFAAVEVPTRDKPTKEQSFWPLGPSNEPSASFGTNGWFSDFRDATSERSEAYTFEVEKGVVQKLELRIYITYTLTTLVCA